MKERWVSGVIINTFGCIKGQGYQKIKYTANAFQGGINHSP